MAERRQSKKKKVQTPNGRPQMKTWYVILDEDGHFLTDDPAETDEIVFRGSQKDAEIALGLILSDGPSGHVPLC